MLPDVGEDGGGFSHTSSYLFPLSLSPLLDSFFKLFIAGIGFVTSIERLEEYLYFGIAFYTRAIETTVNLSQTFLF